MTKGLTGIPSLAYLGVNAGSPPNIKMYTRSPNPDDSKNFIIGDLWINTTPTPAALRELWILVALLGDYATWVKILPSTGGGGGNLRSDDALISVPDGLGAINVTGGQPYVTGSDAWLNDPVYSNIFTAANPINNTLEVVLKRSIMQPKGTADGTRGLYGIDGDDFMHGFGTGNTMLGPDAGNRTLNVGAAINNTCIGYNTLQGIITANHCTGLGFNVLTNVVGSGYLIAIGQNAGSNYILNESSDILIGNPGILGGGEDNVIRIGVMGNGNGEQNQCFLAGVWNSPAVPVVNTGLVIVDDAGQLYVDDLAANSVIMTDAGGNPIAVKGALGTVLTGQGAGPADPTPAFLPITSSGGTVTISTDPITNAINLEAAGVAGLVQLTTDAGVALPLAGNINVLGGELIETDAAVPNTVTVNLTRGADGQIIVGNTAAASTYRDLICSDGSLSVDFSNPAQVDLKVVGIPPVGGVNALYDHALLSVPPTLNHIQIEQGANITSIGDVPTSKITISVTDDVTLAGFLHAAGEIQTTGVGSSLITDLGHVKLPNTDVAGFGGQIQFGGTRWISNYGTSNVFVGPNSGSLSLNTLSAKDCTFIGKNVGAAHLTGESNTSVGSGSFDVNVSGAQCTILGVSAFGNDQGSSYSTCIGWRAGYSALGSNNNSCLYIENEGVNGESNVIRIGQDGVSAHHQDKCYIAGIYNKVPGPIPEMVTIGSDGKLGTAGIPSGGAATFVTDSGTATVSGTTIQVKGGDNINTSGATNIVTVNLDRSIMQDMTTGTGAGASGFYSLFARGSTAYTTYRFMHAYGTSCAYLGLGAGSVSSTAVLSCVGVGANSMPILQSGAYNNNAIGKDSMKLATTAKNCICLGTSSGSALTTSSGNILIGTSAGSNYDAENYNIIIGGTGGTTAGDASSPFDTRQMKIGYKEVINPATGVITTHGTDDTYIYGIYNRTISSTATPVYVDHLGKLGTAGACAFSFHLINNLNNITGDGTLYRFGSTTGSIGVEFDKTSSLTIGGAGSPTIFKAPYDGRYQFSATVTYIIPGTMPPPVAPRLVDPLYMIVTPLDPADPGKSKMFTTYLPDPVVGIDQYVSEIVTSLVELSAGDTVQWACRTSGGTKRIGLMANQPGGGGLPLLWATYFSGSKVS